MPRQSWNERRELDRPGLHPLIRPTEVTPADESETIPHRAEAAWREFRVLVDGPVELLEVRAGSW